MNIETPSRGEIVLFAFTVLGGIIGGAIVALPSYWGATREMDVKMVEIAVGILSQEPKENIAPAREWAVDVISHYADVKPSKVVRTALVNNKGLSYSYSYDFFVSEPPPQQVPNDEVPNAN